MTDKSKEQGKKDDIDSSKITIDDAGRVKSEQPELTEEQLKDVAGGLRHSGICRIQSDPRGCSMNM